MSDSIEDNTVPVISIVEVCSIVGGFIGIDNAGRSGAYMGHLLGSSVGHVIGTIVFVIKNLFKFLKKASNMVRLLQVITIKYIQLLMVLLGRFFPLLRRPLFVLFLIFVLRFFK